MTTTRAMMPIGTLTRNTQRQPLTHRIWSAPAKKPPITGPSAGARTVGTMRMVDARARSAGGKARYSMADDADARRAAKVIHGFGCKQVLIKGGHLLAERATDLLYDGRFFTVFKGEFIETPHTHGTGCTFASAIAAHLARGKSVSDAVHTAKTYLTEAIRHGLAIGHGQGPTDHFYFLE